MSTKIFWSALLGMMITGLLSAQEQTDKQDFFSGMDYQVRGDFSIGGSSPLGLPRSIRSIQGYNPTLQLGLEANATKWFSENKDWGLRVGARVEGRGMKTKAVVKDYLTEIISDDAKVRGYFTGDVSTNVKNSYVTFPISVVHKLGNRWNVYGGLYFAGLLDSKFSGTVSSGHFRDNTPTGTELTFEKGSDAPYDFSNEVRNFQWGVQLGAEWYLKKHPHFFLFPEVDYGANGLFKKDFDAISFTMHNIYLNLGFGYKF